MSLALLLCICMSYLDYNQPLIIVSAVITCRTCVTLAGMIIDSLVFTILDFSPIILFPLLHQESESSRQKVLYARLSLVLCQKRKV